LTTLYDTDFAEWATQQANRLRNGDYADLDVANIAEEIESLGKAQKRELASRLATILEHLLKLHCDLESPAANKWRRTILIQRNYLSIMLEDNATLAANVGDYLPKAYRNAVEQVALITKCQVDDFAQVCPWTVSEVLRA